MAQGMAKKRANGGDQNLAMMEGEREGERSGCGSLDQTEVDFGVLFLSYTIGLFTLLNLENLAVHDKIGGKSSWAVTLTSSKPPDFPPNFEYNPLKYPSFPSSAINLQHQLPQCCCNVCCGVWSKLLSLVNTSAIFKHQ